MRLFGLALSLVVVGIGCGSDSVSTVTDGGMVPMVVDASERDVTPLPLPDGGDAQIPDLDGRIVSFCVDLSERLCGSLERCACGTVNDETCRMTYRSQCELQLFGVDVRRALADGRMVFDVAAAARMVSSLDDAALCDTARRGMWSIRDYYTFGGVLEGTVQAGDPCTAFVDTSSYGYVSFLHLDECAGGVCDARRCVRFSGVGGMCDASHVCADLDAPVSWSWSLRFMPLPCERATPDAPSGACTAKRSDGSPCARSTDCQSGRCDAGACTALGAMGETCTNSHQCQSGVCALAIATCGPGALPLGTECNYADECVSGYCAWIEGRRACAPTICTVTQYGGLPGLFPR